MLEIKNIHKVFNPGTINEKHALKGVNLVLEDGDFVTVIGGNGAGKSTMLNAMLNNIPHQGEVSNNNEDINKKYDNYIFIVVIHNSNFKNYRHLGNVL